MLNRELLQDGIIHLNNYLAKEIALGKLGLTTEMFKLLKWAAENRVFIDNGRIYPIFFSNTMLFAIKNNQITWAKDYLKNNEQYLNAPNKNLVLGYLKASLAYTEKKFETVVSLLSTLQPSHQIQYYFFFKSVITRSYFELILQGKLEYLESLHNELDAFEKGVRRNRKFAKARKENYLNYIKILRLLNVLVLGCQVFLSEVRFMKLTTYRI